MIPPLWWVGWDSQWSGHKDTIRGTTPVNPCTKYLILCFTALIFFLQKKILQAILAVHEACICRYKNINAVEEHAWNTSTKVLRNNKVTALLDGQTKDFNKTPKQNQFNLINTKSFKLSTIQN